MRFSLLQSVRGVASIGVLLGATACAHDAPTATRPSRAALSLHATVTGTPADGAIDIVVSYRRDGGRLAPLDARPSSIPLVRGTTARRPVDVDLAPCLGDAERANAAEPGCPVVVELTLRDGAGALLDRQQVSPPGRVAPGQVAEVPAVTLAEVGDVAITRPASARVRAGERVQLSATVHAPNGSAIAGYPVAWSSSNPVFATVNAATGEVTGLAPGSVTITATAGAKSDQVTLAVVGRVERVTLTPNPVFAPLNGTVQMSITAVDAAGNPVTDLAQRTVSWTTDSPAVATVSASGLVTGVALGTTGVSATVDGVRGSAPLTVRAASITISPTEPKLAVGETVTLKATPVDAIGAPIAVAVSWSSDNPNVATVSAAGVVTGVAIGSTTVQATAGGVTGSTTVDVVTAVLDLSPSSPVVVVGATQQLTASGATGAVTWTSSDPGVAAVSPTGVVTGKFPGSVTVEARSGAQRGSASVTVRAGSLRVTPSPASVRQGATVDLTANALDVAGTPIAGVKVDWASGNASIASVSATGRVTGVALGTVTISAVGGGAEGSTQVTVLAPATPSLEKVSGDGVSCPVNTFTCNFQVRVRNPQGQPMPGATVVWRVPVGGSVTYSDTTDGQGLSSATNVYKFPTPGTYTQTATLMVNAQPIATVSFQFTLTPPTAVTLVPQQSKTTCAVSTFDCRFAVRVTDAQGRPVPNVEVRWAVPAGGPNTYVGFTDVNGLSTASNEYTFPTAGTYVQTATLFFANRSVATLPISFQLFAQYVGSVAASPTVQFGGGANCTYTVTFTNITMPMTFFGNGGSGSVQGTMTEVALYECPFAPIPANVHQYVSTGSQFADNTLGMSFRAATSNNPQGDATFVGGYDPVTDSFSGTLTIRRTDQKVSSLNWTVAIPIVLRRSR